MSIITRAWLQWWSCFCYSTIYSISGWLPSMIIFSKMQFMQKNDSLCKINKSLLRHAMICDRERHMSVHISAENEHVK